MAEQEPKRDIRTLIHTFRTSEHWAVSLARDILWVVGVVVAVALALFLICGTWPAVVTVESGSMEPHMNIGDLVVVVQADRFGPLQTWDDAHATGYQKFGDYGDVGHLPAERRDRFLDADWAFAVCKTAPDHPPGHDLDRGRRARGRPTSTRTGAR